MLNRTVKAHHMECNCPNVLATYDPYSANKAQHYLQFCPLHTTPFSFTFDSAEQRVEPT